MSWRRILALGRKISKYISSDGHGWGADFSGSVIHPRYPSRLSYSDVADEPRVEHRSVIVSRAAPFDPPRRHS